MSVMPIQKPGKSKQNYGTPRNFLDAVEARFGKINFDLAAEESNKVCDNFFGIEQNSLNQDWSKLSGNLWLNPPFGDIEPWAKKCAETREAWILNGELITPPRILFLTPASIGSNWFQRHVYDHAMVLALNPRLSFNGTSAPYPKDCILSVYEIRTDFKTWRWK